MCILFPSPPFGRVAAAAAAADVGGVVVVVVVAVAVRKVPQSIGSSSVGVCVCVWWQTSQKKWPVHVGRGGERGERGGERGERERD